MIFPLVNQKNVKYVSVHQIKNDGKCCKKIYIQRKYVIPNVPYLFVWNILEAECSRDRVCYL